MNSKIEILKSALDENLEIELEKIPEDRIIKKSHTFSNNFEKRIEDIEDSLRKKYTKKQSKERKNIFDRLTINRRWLYIGTPLAASFILFLTIWWNNGFDNFINMKSDKLGFSQEAQDQILQEEGADESDAEEEAYMVQENSLDIAEPEAAVTASDSAITIQANQIEYSVSDIVILTITNNSDKEVIYSEDISLEILENGEWSGVSLSVAICGTESITTIPAGESSIVEIPLEIFAIDKFDTTYRLSKFIDGELQYVTIDIVKENLP